MSVGLYLMTEKGVVVLRAALASGASISHVTTAPAEGMIDDSHQLISKIAKDHKIPTFLRAHPAEFNGDFSIAAGWRWMLNIPNLVVLHDSLLPFYRGFSPLITALVNGEPEVGVTAFLAEDEPDTGPIIAQHSMPVTYPTRMRDVLDRIMPLYDACAREVLEQIPDPRYRAQNHKLASWSLWRDHDDYRIDWTKDAPSILRLIDAASEPFPGAWTTRGGQMMRVHRATVMPDRAIEDRTPGKVSHFDRMPVVVCGSGLLRLDDYVTENAIQLRTRFT